MKPTTSLSALALALTSFTSLASAQFLNNQQYGILPACTSNCPALTAPQSQCGSNGWACFCSGVWSQIQSAPTQICAQTCTNPADVQLAYQWYNSNCGSDNGASAHPNGVSGGSGGSGSNNGGSGGSGTSSSVPSSSSGTTSSGSSSSNNAPHSWWDGHWRWIVMIIVLFLGLLGLAFLGIWLKKRHYRRRDQITSGFNSGITERAPPMSSNPNVDGNPDASALSAAAVSDPNYGGRDSPVRTREAYMPYGYGYTRSESRLGSNPEIARANSPLARGQTPVREMERGTMGQGEEGAAAAGKKARRVLVRERSGADSAEDVPR